MTGAILIKTVPAMTMRSAWRGVPRITSAPNRAMSYLLVMLVAISTKQQERPKLNGQTEFLRLHATRSSRRDITRVRRIASPRVPSAFSACCETSGRLIDQRMAHHPLLTRYSSASLSPIKSADAPQIGKRRENRNERDKAWRAELRPPSHANRAMPITLLRCRTLGDGGIYNLPALHLRRSIQPPSHGLYHSPAAIFHLN